MDHNPHVRDVEEPVADSSNDFSKEQYTLAMTLSRDKPPHLSMEEYANRILGSRRPASSMPPSDRRVIDSAEFWKSQAAEYLDQTRDLKAQLAQLKDENRQLRRSISSADGSQSSADDKFHDELLEHFSSDAVGPDDQGYALIAGRKRKLHFHVEDPAVDVFEDGSDRIISGYISRLENHRLELRQLPNPPTTAKEIRLSSDTIINVIISLSTILGKLCTPLCFDKEIATSVDKPESKRSRMINDVTDRVILTFLSCIGPFDNLCKTITGRKDESGKIIYHFVDFYRTNLGLLARLAAQQTNGDPDALPRRTLRSQSQSKRRRIDSREYIANKLLGRVLTCIVFNINWKEALPAHGELLEGILYTIIHHAGRVLSVALFGEVVADSDLVGHITKSASLDQLLSNVTNKSENRYIIQILNSALGGVSKKTLFVNVLQARKVNQHARASASDLIGKARTIMQNTLVKAMSADDVGEQLEEPAALMDDVDRRCKDDDFGIYGANWYVGKIWDLIGWDVSTF